MQRAIVGIIGDLGKMHTGVFSLETLQAALLRSRETPQPGLFAANISAQTTGVYLHGDFLQEIDPKLCRHPSCTY